METPDGKALPQYAEDMQPDVPPTDAVDLAVAGDFLYLRGAEATIETLLHEVFPDRDAVGSPWTTSSIVSGASAGVVGVAALQVGEQCYRLTADSMAKLEKFGPQLDESGALRAFVRADTGRFAGQLRFNEVAFAPEQALALQSAAVSLALRTAIADVKAAVEVVERKVSDIQRHVRAREVGEVVGTYRTLEHIVSRTRERGHLLEADWDSVADAGRDLAQALETLRAYVAHSVADISPDSSLSKRAEAVAALADPSAAPAAFRLILVAEQALHLWEYLRIERVRQTDRTHVESAIEDAQISLRKQFALDSDLVTQTLSKVDTVRVIRPLELQPLARSAMERASATVLTEVESFATSARVDLPELEKQLTRPGVAEAKVALRQTAQAAGHQAVALSREARRATTESVTSLTRRLRDARADESDQS